jgi:hypothetical protein
MKHFNYLNQGVHINNLEIKNYLDHEDAKGSIAFII